MKLQELFLIESSEEDRAITSLSSAVYAGLQKYVGIGENIILGKIGDLYDTPLVALNNVVIELQCDTDIKRALEVTDPLVMAYGYWDSPTHTIALNYDLINADRMKTTVAHELRHALDDVKSNNAASSSVSYNRPRKKQHTGNVAAQPSEINARFIEVLQVIAKRAPLWLAKVTPDRARDRLHNDLTHLLTNYHIAQFFPEKTQSPDYKRLLKRGTDFIDKELKSLGATTTPGQLTK
jgi:hypothetical protein